MDHYFDRTDFSHSDVNSKPLKLSKTILTLSLDESTFDLIGMDIICGKIDLNKKNRTRQLFIY